MRIPRFFFLLLLFCLAFLALCPVLLLLSGAFMSPRELSENLGSMLAETEGYGAWSLLPREPTLRSVVELLLDSPEFFPMFWNSLWVTGGTLLGQMLVGAPAAWGLARFRFPFRRVFLGLYLVLMLMPFQVTMLSGFLVLERFSLLNTLWSLILPGVFSAFPVFLMYRFFRSIPEAILESARLDTKNAFQVFRYIGVPLGSAGMVSALVLGFLESWNQIEQPMAFLKEKSLWPLSLYLPTLSLERAGPAFAGSLLALIPALLVFLSGRDYLEQGIVAAAIKE